MDMVFQNIRHDYGVDTATIMYIILVCVQKYTMHRHEDTVYKYEHHTSIRIHCGSINNSNLVVFMLMFTVYRMNI